MCCWCREHGFSLSGLWPHFPRKANTTFGICYFHFCGLKSSVEPKKQPGAPQTINFVHKLLSLNPKPNNLKFITYDKVKYQILPVSPEGVWMETLLGSESNKLMQTQLSVKSLNLQRLFPPSVSDFDPQLVCSGVTR